MMRSLRLRFIITLTALGISFYSLYPTIYWYRLPQETRDDMERSKDKIINRILNLGLDLRGGTHLLLELDKARLDPKLTVTDGVTRAIEVIRNRVDQFGVSEPLIARQGEQWIVVQLPGIKNPERAKELIGKTALLEFRMVDDSGKLEQVTSQLKKTPRTIWEEVQSGKADKATLKAVPAGFEIVPDREGRFYLLNSESNLTGASLLNAKVELGGEGHFGYPSVSLEFTNDGARKFADITEQNIGRNLAIVLDGIVQSAPVIRSAIPDGRAVIEGTFSSDDAKLLSTVLRAGALPAPVKIIEERTVGPSLGEDSIKSGVRAAVIGFILVVLFMAFYYRTSGLIADFALLLNFVFMFAILAGLHATLTLPGIAGTILSLAMAVDANVLILERIREELRKGKTVALAIDAGYERVLPTIIDSHVTTLMAGALLYQFGTGPVRGFAVTLFWGLLVSLFTSIVVTHIIYDAWQSSRRLERLSI